jgi:peptidoglycan hydrolase-like protein with peptidoglycan-binding domain
VLALCLFFGILAAAGVFSGSKQPAALTTTTLPRPQTTTRAVTTTAKPTVVVPTTPLQPGDTGAAVTQLQKALTAAGFSPGKADGDYGDATTNAVKRFQSAHGLAADGVAGSKTLAALTAAVG